MAELLKDKQIAVETFKVLKRLKPDRQFAAARLMIAMDQYSVAYANSLFAASSADQLVKPNRKTRKGLSESQRALMEQESATLDQEIEQIEKSYGSDHLDLVLAIGYISKILDNAAVVRHLARGHPEILGEFQRIAEQQSAVT